MDSEISIKAVNSAKRKRVEEAMDLGQGDDRLPGTDRMLTDVAMVPPILKAGIKSTGDRTKKSDRTLIGARLEMEIQKFGQRTLDGSGRPKCHGRLFGHDDARHHPEA